MTNSCAKIMPSSELPEALEIADGFGRMINAKCS
jgi:hypothetical protein